MRENSTPWALPTSAGKMKLLPLLFRPKLPPSGHPLRLLRSWDHAAAFRRHQLNVHTAGWQQQQHNRCRVG